MFYVRSTKTILTLQSTKKELISSVSASRGRLTPRLGGPRVRSTKHFIASKLFPSVNRNILSDLNMPMHRASHLQYRLCYRNVSVTDRQHHVSTLIFQLHSSSLDSTFCHTAKGVAHTGSSNCQAQVCAFGYLGMYVHICDRLVSQQ